MVLYYTNSNTYLGQQNNPAESIGGFLSGSVVPNNFLGNLFSDISFNSVKQKRIDTRAIVLQNTTGVNVTNIIFGFKYPINPSFKLEAAFVTLDSTGQKMEKLQNGNASPYNAVWQEPSIITAGPDNSVNIGDLAINVKLGIWLRRTMNGLINVPAFATIDDEIAYYKSITDPNYDFSQKIQLIIKYTTP